MKDFARMVRHATSVSVVLPIEAPEILAIGENLRAIREEAYMNGYNWSALIAHYLQLHSPHLAEGMGNDPEAGTYVAYYKAGPDNEEKARQLTTLLNELLDKPQALYDFLKAEGDDVEWD